MDSNKPSRSDGQAGYISGSEILEVSSHHVDRSSRLSSPLHRISSASWNLSPNFALRHPSPQNEFDAADFSPLEPALRGPAVCPDETYAADSPLQQALCHVDAASPLPLSDDIGQYSTLLVLAGAYTPSQRQSLGRSVCSLPAGDHREHIFFDDPTGPDPDEESVNDNPTIDIYDEAPIPSVYATQNAMTNFSAPQLHFDLPTDMGRSTDFDDELDFPDDVVDQLYTLDDVASVAQIDASTDMTNRDLRSPIDTPSQTSRKDEEIYLGPCLFSDEGEESD